MKKNHSKAYLLISLLLGAVVVTTGLVMKQDADAAVRIDENINKPNEIETEKVDKIDTNKINKLETNKDCKFYSNLDNAKLNAGFDFKVPDYIIDGNKPYGYHVRKISDSSNALQIAFNNDSRKNKFSLFIFKDEAKDALKKINETRNNSETKQDIQINEENMNINNIKGKCIELTISNLDSKYNSKEQNKYFVWEDEGVSYAVEYSSILDGGKVTATSLSQEEIGKIAESLTEIDKIKNVDYTESIVK